MRRAQAPKGLSLFFAGAAVVALCVAGACGGAPPAPTAASPTVDLTLNGQKSGNFSCAGGMFFVTTLANSTAGPIHVDGLLLNLTSLSPACLSHPAPIGGIVDIDVAAGTTREIRRVDLGGDLCSPPFGQPGCDWRAKAVLTTTLGTLGDEIPFSSAGTSPVAPGNNPPTVSISGGGGCYPSRSRPCSVSFDAVASDPDGDRLHYEWSGCASGAEPHVSCFIPSPGSYTATVTVTDGRGGKAKASRTAAGTNRPPTATFGYPNGAESSNTSVSVLGNGYDPDEGFFCGRNICVEARATGACGPPSPFLDCTCLAGIEVDVRTITGPGSCSVTVVVQDEWGLRGSGTLTFQVKAP